MLYTKKDISFGKSILVPVVDSVPTACICMCTLYNASKIVLAYRIKKFVLYNSFGDQ
jgi:hypothetical protein